MKRYAFPCVDVSRFSGLCDVDAVARRVGVLADVGGSGMETDFALFDFGGVLGGCGGTSWFRVYV